MVPLQKMRSKLFLMAITVNRQVHALLPENRVVGFLRDSRASASPTQLPDGLDGSISKPSRFDLADS
jgi:hypothetical protein